MYDERAEQTPAKENSIPVPPMLFMDDDDLQHENFIPAKESIIELGVVSYNAVMLIGAVVLVLSPFVIGALIFLTVHHAK